MNELAKPEKKELVMHDRKLAEIHDRARMYIAADILPPEWLKGDKTRALARTAVVIELAQEKNVNPLIFLQNVDFIAGKLCWKSTFLLQLLKMAGWTGIEYKWDGDPQKPGFWDNEQHGCTFGAVNPTSGQKEWGTKITVYTVRGERWTDKQGSKWLTMPEQMFKYRAISFFCRSNAPEVMGGLYSSDELKDVVEVESLPKPPEPPKASETKPEPKKSSIMDPGSNYWHD